MVTGEYVIQTSQITKRFNKVHALTGLDLSVEPGIFGLIGPNGAGKTTLCFEWCGEG